MNDETDLSTEQAEAAEKIWLSRPHENCGRAKSYPPPAKSRAEGSIRLKYPLSKTDRLRKRREFEAITRQKRRVVGRFLCLDRREAHKTRLGITASGRYGNAVERNRFKRLVREVFRTSLLPLSPPFEIHVVPRQLAKNASLCDIRGEILRLLKL